MLPETSRNYRQLMLGELAAMEMDEVVGRMSSKEPSKAINILICAHKQVMMLHPLFGMTGRVGNGGNEVALLSGMSTLPRQTGTAICNGVAAARSCSALSI